MLPPDVASPLSPAKRASPAGVIDGQAPQWIHKMGRRMPCDSDLEVQIAQVRVRVPGSSGFTGTWKEREGAGVPGSSGFRSCEAPMKTWAQPSLWPRRRRNAWQQHTEIVVREGGDCTSGGVRGRKGDWESEQSARWLRGGVRRARFPSEMARLRVSFSHRAGRVDGRSDDCRTKRGPTERKRMSHHGEVLLLVFLVVGDFKSLNKYFSLYVSRANNLIVA